MTSGTRRARPLLFYVVALAIALAAPPLAVAGFLAANWVQAERARLQEQTHAVTDGAFRKVDTFLTGKIAMLQALATSPALQVGDFRRLDAQARELLDLQGLNIVLRDLSGQQLLNTRRPWGTQLPRVTNNEADRIVAATHQPYISDLYAGVMAGAPLIRIIVPVVRNSAVVYTLTASITPDALGAMLREAGIRRPHFASIADRQGLTIARAEHDPALVGKPLAGLDGIKGEIGSWSGVNAAGVAVFGTYRRSSLSGWVYTAGIDTAVLNKPLYRSISILVALAVAMSLLGLGVAGILVRRILQSQRLVSAAASSLGTGTVVEPPKTLVTEANATGEALSEASRRLRDQASSLSALNRDLEARVSDRTREFAAQTALLETTLDNMAQGLMVIDADGTVPICNRRAIEMLDLPAELMASRPTFAAVRRYQLENGEFVRNERQLQEWVESRGLERTAHSYERERPNGTTIEVKTVPLANGSSVRTYTDITPHKQAERIAFELSRRDPLTGLGNRTLFLERLESLLENDRTGTFAVLCLDLDRFKSVNDTFGHHAGDALLMEVASRILAHLGPEDVAARLAGDEFAIIQVASDEGRAVELAKALLDAISDSIVLDTGTRVVVGASIGIAVSPRDASRTEELLKCADLALYRAKEDGRTTYRVFEPEMDLAARERRALEADLAQALPRGQFEIHYQPVINLARGEASSFEALLRWKHPTRGYVSPAEFIPIAEDAKIIPQIGEWVLREACKEASSWPGRVAIAVNISPLQFRAPGLLDIVTSALKDADLRPERLELEITEAVLMQQCDEVLTTLRSLRQVGVRIALDDFGTGYSSLSYLHQFPLDRIKIDRSFIKASEDPTSAAIIRSIIGLGNRLGTAITAEGVETQAQLEFVREEGCHAAQGFLFSKPIPAAAARRYMRDRRDQAA